MTVHILHLECEVKGVYKKKDKAQRRVDRHWKKTRKDTTSYLHSLTRKAFNEDNWIDTYKVEE